MLPDKKTQEPQKHNNMKQLGIETMATHISKVLSPLEEQHID